MTFDEAFDRLMQHEGGYSHHPADPGGQTRYGITESVARSHGYAGAMRDLPIELAKKIARTREWDAVQADALPAAIRFDVFDAAYNSGTKQAIKWLQRAIGARDDGVIGAETKRLLAQHDPYRIAARFAGHRLQMMTDLDTWMAFGRGWARRVARNLMEV